MSHKKRNSSNDSKNADSVAIELEIFKHLLDTEDFLKLSQDIEKPLTPTIRINQLKHESEKLVKSLKDLYGWDMEQVPFCQAGFRVRSNRQALSSTIEHRMGSFYIQEAASMLPAELFDFNALPHPLILDLTASPGGKTTHLADRTKDQGFILANDSSHERLKALQIVLRNWGVINQAITCFNGELFGQWFPETFDFVLLDAPCSMQGLRTSESHPMRSISDKERLRLVIRQQNLLISALQATRIGGQVVYSTCTLSPDENEGVLTAVLKRFSGCFTITDLHNRLPISAPGLAFDKNQIFAPEVKNGIRLWPHLCSTAGFFTARLDKVAPLPIENAMVEYPKTNFPYFLQLNHQQLADIYSQLIDEYGFNLENLLKHSNATIYQHEHEVWLVPDRLYHNFPSLQVISTGLCLGKLINNKMIVSHDFVARFGSGFKRGTLQIGTEYLLTWISGQDIHPFPINPEDAGKIIVVKDEAGRNLGRGKTINNRLKNLLPHRLF